MYAVCVLLNTSAYTTLKFILWEEYTQMLKKPMPMYNAY